VQPSEPVFYLIPGLGADERVFQFLRLRGEVHVLPWISPASAHEPLAPYAARLAAAIPETQPCWLVGVSFGGLLALEVGRLRPRARLVLISSLGSAAELPPLLRLARATRLYRLLPPQLLQLAPRLAQWFFGAKNGAEYHLLCRIIRDTDPGFARWAIARLLEWDSTGVRSAVRVHGTHDRLLPATPAAVQHLIPGGGHFMIVSHAARISTILNQLAEVPPASSG
jgi:pimeloyl-ACP methyl ester carboxylesterase